MSRKLLLLGTVVGALSFLSPAYAIEVWDFFIPTGVNLGTTHDCVGSAGTVVSVLAITPVPNPGDLIAKNN